MNQTDRVSMAQKLTRALFCKEKSVWVEPVHWTLTFYTDLWLFFFFSTLNKTSENKQWHQCGQFRHFSEAWTQQPSSPLTPCMADASNRYCLENCFSLLNKLKKKPLESPKLHARKYAEGFRVSTGNETSVLLSSNYRLSTVCHRRNIPTPLRCFQRFLSVMLWQQKK